MSPPKTPTPTRNPSRTRGKGITKAVRLDLTPDLHARLKKMACDEGMALRNYIENAIVFAVGGKS